MGENMAITAVSANPDEPDKGSDGDSGKKPEVRISKITGKPVKQGNWKAGPGRGHTKDPNATTNVPRGEFDRLKAMRYVLNNSPKKSEPVGVKACRDWLSRSPGQFMAALAALEEEQSRQKAAEMADEPDGEERLPLTETDRDLREETMALIRRLAEKAKTLPQS